MQCHAWNCIYLEYKPVDDLMVKNKTGHCFHCNCVSVWFKGLVSKSNSNFSSEN